ncbi:MAG: DUF86 domain-containing protein [Thermoplasmata archaeon]
MKEIHSKLEDLRKYTNLLKQYRQESKERLMSDLTLRGAVERYLQVSIECVLEIGEMIISKESWRKPETYREVIEILGEKNVLPSEFAERFSRIAGLRNILVHRYADVDLDELYHHLQEDIGDFDEFARHIANHLIK